MVQRFHGIFREAAADRHISRVGCAGLGFLYGLYTIIKRLVNPNVPMGFSALMAALVFFGGMIMIMLGLIGEYVDVFTSA